MMFLPAYLKDEFEKATIVNPDGSERKLIKQTNRLSEELINDTNTTKEWFTPMLCSMIIFLLVLSITFVEWKRKTYFRLVDCILFFLAGVAGTVLFFLCFISTHPCVRPNWSIVWLQPFDLIAVILFAVKKFRKAAYYYHFINFAALTLLLAGWYFIPQHLNIAFIPLVATLWLRSGYGIYRWRAHI
jgi:membrane-associated HD superfamily phosphohydrolase